MIARAARYALANARIRTALSDLLDAQEYRMLIHAPSLDDMLAALKTTGYADVLQSETAGFAAAIRQYRLSKADRLIASLPSGARKLCGSFLARFEMDALKVMLRAVVAGTARRQVLSMLQPMPSRSVLPVERLLAAKTLEEAAVELAETPYDEIVTGALRTAEPEKYPGQRASPILLAIDNHLDRWFLSRLVDAVSAFRGDEARIVGRLIDVMVDVTNVLWTERLRRSFRFSPEETARHLFPAGRCFGNAKKRLVLAQWDGEGQPPFLATGLKEASNTLRVSMMRTVAREAALPLFAIPFQAGVSLSYLVQGELETADLVTLYEGRRWGREPMQLADELIRFHGRSLSGGEIA